MCVICMKYKIIILIIIIISLGQILLSYIANTSRMHAMTAREHTHTPPPPPFRLALFVGAQPWRPAPLAIIAGSRVIQINTHAGHPISPRFLMFFAYKKLLGRTEMRTLDRMYCQTIRTVRDISRADRARIATCRLRTPTDRLFPPYIMSQSSLFCPRNRSPTTCPCPHINLCLSHF